ncbi:hypothetical protein [Lysobacter silvisoli]|uniref:Uncharacterized protein n=1 Tax=Lysobacter silvisoli TaxID=2293254 RepID=A0A371JY75_9GAMM|nr:hypothetical protein [Lysobacter silvisoli]RDZ26615.1 hypothetical protein DX914_16675 [Lysobacter silvisoli]
MKSIATQDLRRIAGGQGIDTTIQKPKPPVDTTIRPTPPPPLPNPIPAPPGPDKETEILK